MSEITPRSARHAGAEAKGENEVENGTRLDIVLLLPDADGLSPDFLPWLRNELEIWGIKVVSVKEKETQK